MPSLLKLVPVDSPPAVAPTATERFTRTLVALTRTVWDPSCTFESAIGSICEAAAQALQVERVSIWHYDSDAALLRCLHAYTRASADHEPVEHLQTLSLDDDDYMAALKEVRTFEAADVDDAAPGYRSHNALRDYLQRHRIHAVLDAPAFVEGALQGVICHESIDRVRSWSREEITFAASMGDYVAMAYEIARRRRAEAEIEHLRLHDPATGLPNRDYMVELVRQRVARCRKSEPGAAIVHVRIDPSCGVAWPSGAPTVDTVLARIADELRGLTRAWVDLARVRDHGFAFLLSRCDGQQHALELAQRTVAKLAALRWAHAEVAPNAVAGVAFADAEAQQDPQVLLRRAEEAAEQANQGDKFSCAVFDPERHQTLVAALHFEGALRQAFLAGRFELHYQPEYDAHDHRWVAAESLLRWRDGERLVSAFEFIGVIESCGLMLPVGRWVLQQACADAVGWPPTPAGAVVAVRVNVSARQFDEAGLVEDVTAALEDSGLAPERLCLELTETTLMRDMPRALTVLEQLRALGVQVAIDDFGTGYASLVYLRRLPIDVLKIDRSFVEGIPGEIADTAIVQAVVGLAHSLGIDVVAEGVERLAQQQALQKIGVRRMQGWLYGRAIDNLSLHRLLAAEVPDVAVS